MADAFPGRHTTTTTVTQTAVSPEIRYDRGYIRTTNGLIKLFALIFNLAGFISIQCSGYSHHSRGEFFSTVSMTGFWFTLLLLVFYMFHICEKFYKIPWLKIEMYYLAIMFIFYIFAAFFAITFGSEAYTAAGVFGFCAVIIYGYDAWLKFSAVKRGEIAQGVRNVSQQQTSATIA